MFQFSSTDLASGFDPRNPDHDFDMNLSSHQSSLCYISTPARKP